MTIKRLTPSERKLFKHWKGPDNLGGQEPALGTVDERLGILVRRFGGRTGPLPRLTETEREELLAE